jgi:hypothetical protein
MVAFKCIIPLRLIGVPMLFLTLPLACDGCVQILWRDRSALDCEFMSLSGKFAYRIIKFITILNIGLKLDSQIDWDWNTVLWPVWLCLFLCGLFCFGAFFLACLTLFSWVMSEAGGSEALASAWVVTTAFTFTASFSYFFIVLARMLEQDAYHVEYFTIPLVFTVYFIATLHCLSEHIV